MKWFVKSRLTRYAEGNPRSSVRVFISSVQMMTIFFVLCFQTSVQVPAPAAGVIEELLVPDGGKVEGGTPLFKLRRGGLLIYS